jgi:hypothetical protein
MLLMTADPGVSAPTEAERAAATAMQRIIWGIHSSRAVYVAARLGIADLLADGPVSAAELARVTGVHQPSLYRVLRLLAALDVFDEVEPGSFGLTVLGDRLRSDAAAGMRSWAIFLEAIGGVLPFEHILETVRTGTPGIDIAFGMGIFEFLAQRPGNAATFDAAMSERTAAYAPSVADGYDFSDIRSLVDVGGGTGTLPPVAGRPEDRHRAAGCVSVRHHRRVARLTAPPRTPGIVAGAGSRRVWPGTFRRAGRPRRCSFGYRRSDGSACAPHRAVTGF